MDSGSASSRERIVIDLPLPAYIPTDWIPEMALRLQLYRRIGNIQSIEDVEAMRKELIDRFGQLPVAVEGLMYQIEVKALAQTIHATHVSMPRDHVQIRLPYLAKINRGLLSLALGAEVDVTRTDVRFPAEARCLAKPFARPVLRDLQDKLDLLAMARPNGSPARKSARLMAYPARNQQAPFS